MNQVLVDHIEGLRYQADAHIEAGEYGEARDIAYELDTKYNCRSYAMEIYSDCELQESIDAIDYQANQAFDEARDMALVM